MTVIDAIRSFSSLSGAGVQDVALVVILGDSQAAAPGTQVGSPNYLAGDHSKAVVAYNSGTFRNQPLGQLASNGVGYYSIGPAFAERLHDLTGLGTLLIPDFPTAGTGMFRALTPALNFDFTGTPSAANGNRMFLTDGSIQLDTVMPRTLQFIQNAMPGFRVTKKILIHFDGYTEVAEAFRVGSITQAEVIAYYEAMIDYFEANWGFEKLVIVPPGFVGNTSGDLAAETKRWDLARAAALASCDGVRIINGCDWLDEFSPLVVDGNGGHISGAYKYDLSHYDGATNVAIGRSVAEALAAVL